MKTLKLILKSLISNNACIEGGRKKPWYFAVIMLILSMVFAILPLFVQSINTNGDDVFKANTYGADEAMLAYSDFMEYNGINISVVESSVGKKEFRAINKDGSLITDNSADYNHVTYVQKAAGEPATEYWDYHFWWRNTANPVEFKELAGDGSVSFIYICPNQVFMHIVDINSGKSIKDVNCLDAAASFDVGYSLSNLKVVGGSVTETLSKTFTNWKLFIRTSYNQTRLQTLWQTCLLIGGINLGITVFMGLMIWILTRGKNNPYRLFNLWDTQKMAWWSAITPSILALALGFLLTNFANILFPMLIGIRVMWLSMKSLRPDGTGYAAD